MNNLESDYFIRTINHPYSVSKNRISTICPRCNGGEKHERTFNLYTSKNELFVKCFRENNCGYSTSFKSFLKENNESLYDEYISEKYNKNIKIQDNILDDISFQKPIGRTPKSRKLLQQIKIDEPTYINDELDFNDLKPLSIEALEYLKSRGLTKDEYPYISNWKEFNYKEGGYLFEGKKLFPYKCIVIPFKNKEKWYGFQILSYTSSTKIVYLKDGNESWKVWNYFNCNRNKEHYVFESIYDAMSSGFESNEIMAMMGVSYNKKNKQTVFIMDNQNLDGASLKQTLEYLNDGYDCVFWDESKLEKILSVINKDAKEVKDVNDLKKMGIPQFVIKKFLKSCIVKSFSSESSKLEFLVKYDKLFKNISKQSKTIQKSISNEKLNELLGI